MSTQTITRPLILLAGPKDALQEQIAQWLAGEFDLEIVYDGQSALEAASRRLPDLVLSDVVMPVLDGIGLLGALRDNPDLQHIPVLLFAGGAAEDDTEEVGLQAGADDYLTKPFGAPELLARVESAIKLSRLHQEMSQALQESEARYSAIVEGQSELVCRFRPDGTILFVNGAYARARGATPEELLRSNFWNFIEEEDRPAVRAMLERLTPEQPEIRIENRFETTEGVRHTLWTNRALTFDAEGRATELQSAGIDITERKRAEEALRQLNETLEERVEQRTAQVRDLASRLTMAQLEERRHIAQILHDDLQQLLYGVEMKLTMLRDDLNDLERPDLLETLDEGYAWIERAINTARQLTVELSPPLLKDEGLVDALGWLQRQMLDLHGLDVTVESEGKIYLKDEDLHVLLFQTVRELLFNVKKHAGVNKATVTLKREGDTLVVRVGDRGKGFDTDALGAQGERAGGFGLFSIRERLNLIGGHLEIDSQPGNGTRVEVRAPLALANSS